MLKEKEKKEKEKEQVEKLKALRRELEEKLEEQLPPDTDEAMRVEVQRINEHEPMDPAQSRKVIEALLFASAKPLTPHEIKKVMKFLTPKDVAGLIQELREEYLAQGRSFEIVEIAGGYEIVTRKEFAPWIFKIELQKKAKQVTQSALETIAILAYKQPITKAEIEDLRGVDASGVVATLMERGLVKIVGRKEVPGRPFLYGTTEKFLEHFGLKSLEDLPNIDEIKNLVETSVKKEDLLGTQNLVDIPEDVAQDIAEAQAEAEESRVEGEAGEILDEAQEEQDESARVAQQD